MEATLNRSLRSKSEGKPWLSEKGHILAFLNKVIIFGAKIEKVQKLGAQNLFSQWCG